MGDAIRAEAERRNMDPTGENLGSLMLQLRKSRGEGVVAELITPRIQASKSDVVIVDGIRSNAEIDVFRGVGDVRILSVHASTNTRFDFLSRRRRRDDPKTPVAFAKRDARELKVGISNSIALADETISNNCASKEELIRMAHDIIVRWAGHGRSS